MIPSDTISRFLEPLDVLFLRGNQLFGDPGSYGEALIPPWPSVAAGAIRTRILTDAGIDPVAFGKGQLPHPELGTPECPGSFMLRAFNLARLRDGKIEILLPPPSDLALHATKGMVRAQRLVPTKLHPALRTSSPLPLLPVLAQSARSKTINGWWLRQSGWQKYLAGHTPDGTDFVRTSDLWSLDERVGVGLADATRSADDGKLFTSRAIALKDNVGFIAAVAGATLPDHGMLRFGGDGRAATIRPATIDWPHADYAAITASSRCRLVLTSPGIFTQGWLPNGFIADGSTYRFDLGDVQGRLVAASVTRNEVVSGWNLAGTQGKGQPKPAQRVAPAGSVYWLDELQASPDALRKLAANGLWRNPCEDAQRHAEGFNRFSLALY
ncbi:type III-B CRISPR module-associated Cmr3 family protein [Kerstersia gyiorum]|uniref:type III-B CRISPR module-associated Cmr3 family protein n=1 Tax=Kerstersia gyiorum TaxID=206506 RepID=UPI003B438FE9